MPLAAAFMPDSLKTEKTFVGWGRKSPFHGKTPVGLPDLNLIGGFLHKTNLLRLIKVIAMTPSCIELTGAVSLESVVTVHMIHEHVFRL